MSNLPHVVVLLVLPKQILGPPIKYNSAPPWFLLGIYQGKLDEPGGRLTLVLAGGKFQFPLSWAR